MYKPGSYSSAGGCGERYDDDRYESRYGSRDDDRNGYGYGRDRDYSYKDDDRYGRYGDSNSRDGDRYSRDEDRFSRDGYRDEEYRGRSQSTERGYDDDGHSSSRYYIELVIFFWNCLLQYFALIKFAKNTQMLTMFASYLRISYYLCNEKLHWVCFNFNFEFREMESIVKAK